MIHKKQIQAVQPFIYPNNSNFKLAVYNSWVKEGGGGIGGRWYAKYYKSISYHLDVPSVCENKKSARLCFVEGASLLFDAFPDYMFYEIIPVIWDCWPRYWATMEKFFRKHNIRIAFFTSSQTASHFKYLFPDKNIFHIQEAIDTELYIDEIKLKNRDIDFLQFGRCSTIIDIDSLSKDINVLSSRNENEAIKTRQDLIKALSNSKITIALTRQDNQPEIAEGIDTLTQRYWECMLSGVILLGRAPQELIDFIGYDPTVKINLDNVNLQIKYILSHIEDYQDLVDRNRTVALQKGDWSDRIKTIMQQLMLLGYKI
jgi:glycosyltransferase involved in cell wall biosynthesis